jgi:hypothetical protein
MAMLIIFIILLFENQAWPSDKISPALWVGPIIKSKILAQKAAERDLIRGKGFTLSL